MRTRLDVALEQRGLAPSRARARDAILRGTVRVNGAVATRPGGKVGPDDALALDDPAAGYVSRAALKLLAGLDAAAIPVAGRACLDVGASTGGFTQVLIERGARIVYALDVGHGQLHPALRDNPSIVSLEGLDARAATSAQVPEPIDLLVCDVSFVSVAKVIAAPLRLCRPGADAVILIKPQFEVGRAHIGKGGIVAEDAPVAAAVEAAIAAIVEQGWHHTHLIDSPIAGGDGNREQIAVLRKGDG